LKKQTYLSLIIFLFISNLNAQSKWKEHLGDYRPYVELYADFPLVQSSPYDHKMKPLLTVKSLGNPLISIGEGQILNKETVKIQFGANGDIEEWKIKTPSDGSSDYFLIEDDRNFKKRLKTANVLRINVLLFQNGEQTIYFNTAGYRL
jgi:hypothetical protein